MPQSETLTLIAESTSIELPANTLLVALDEAGHEGFAPTHRAFGLGGCACLVRHYGQLLDDPWRAMKDVLFEGSTVPLHAADLRSPTEAQLEALGIFFTKFQFFRFAVMAAETFENSTELQLIKIVCRSVLDRVAEIAAYAHPTGVALIFEHSERIGQDVMFERNYSALLLQIRWLQRIVQFMPELPNLSTLSPEQKDVLILSLFERIRLLEERLSKDSHNSSKPPSSDGLQRKPKSLRKAGVTGPGGQKGHPGSTLKRSQTSDRVVTHALPVACDACGTSLDHRNASIVPETRQVIDLPAIRFEVTEHRVLEVQCTCGKAHRSAFPEYVRQAVQYGPAIKATAVYLTQYQQLPVERSAQALHDLFGVKLNRPVRCKAVLPKLAGSWRRRSGKSLG